MIRQLLNILAVLVICLALHPAAQARTFGPDSPIVAVIPEDFPPLFFRDHQTGNPVGLGVEIIEKVAAKSGVPVTFVYGKPWEEIEQAVLNGKADFITLRSINPKTSERFLFTDTLYIAPMSYVVRASGKRPALTAGTPVGVIDGSSAHDYLSKEKPELKAVPYKDFQEMLLAILSGKVDIVLTEPESLMSYARESRLDERLTVVIPPVKENKYGIAMSQASPELRDRLNNVVKEFVQTPEYKRICQKWLASEKDEFIECEVRVVAGIIAAVVVIFLLWHYVVLQRKNRQIKADQQFLQKMIDAIPDQIFFKNRDFKYLGCNRVFAEEFMGRDPQAIVGSDDFKLFGDPELAKFFRELDQETMKQNGAYNTEEQITMADGRSIIVESTRTTFADASGATAGIIGIVRDITDRKRAEDNLTWELQVNETLAGLANNLIEPGRSIGEVAKMVLECAKNLTRSEHGFVSEIDPATFANVGHTLTEMMGDICRIEGTDRSIAFPRSADGTYAYLWGQSLNTGKPFFTNSPADHPTWKGLPKEHVPRERFLSVPALYEGHIIGQIVLANPPADYTEKHLEAVQRIASLYALALNKYRTEQKRDELENQLLQSQKMEAIGQLAGGVAHDFNNILQVISGYSSLLQMDDSLSEKQKSEIEQIASSAEKAAQLTRGLLAFSRKQALVMKQEGLNDIIQHVHKFLARIIGEDISLNTSCCGAELPIVVDKGQIEQVLVNLATNARDAMPGGGIFSVKGEMVHLDESFTDFHQNHVHPGKYALLTVSDTGSGISRELINHIFEPFFTTKEVGKGTGLGMAIIYGIIKQHDGFINVYSEPGQGTTFRIYLPIHEAGSTAIGETVETVPPRVGNETILVAEDEPSVLALVSMGT